MSRWINAAHLTMTATLLECNALGLDREAIAKAIDDAYPFADRSNSPYRAWLKVRREFFAHHGLPRKGDYLSHRARQLDLVSQMEAS